MSEMAKTKTSQNINFHSVTRPGSFPWAFGQHSNANANEATMTTTAPTFDRFFLCFVDPRSGSAHRLFLRADFAYKSFFFLAERIATPSVKEFA